MNTYFESLYPPTFQEDYNQPHTINNVQVNFSKPRILKIQQDIFGTQEVYPEIARNILGLDKISWYHVTGDEIDCIYPIIDSDLDKIKGAKLCDKENCDCAMCLYKQNNIHPTEVTKTDPPTEDKYPLKGSIELYYGIIMPSWNSSWLKDKMYQDFFKRTFIKDICCTLELKFGDDKIKFCLSRSEAANISLIEGIEVIDHNYTNLKSDIVYDEVTLESDDPGCGSVWVVLNGKDNFVVSKASYELSGGFKGIPELEVTKVVKLKDFTGVRLNERFWEYLLKNTKGRRLVVGKAELWKMEDELKEE